MAVLYCNTTTDLTRAYSRIMEYGQKSLRTLKGYKNYSGSVFKFPGSGYVEAMYEDGTKMTLAANLAAVNAAAEWFWDSTNDILYFQPTGGVADNHTYLAGEDWGTVKTDAVTVASREAESLLDKDTPVPVPMAIDGNASYPWDRDFSHAVALIACGHIVARTQPIEYFASGETREGNIAGALSVQGRKIIQEYASHVRRFSWELTDDEIAGANIKPSAANTSAGIIQIKGTYTGGDDAFWKIKIIAGGVVGTSTWQYSLDNGTTYNGTSVATDTDWDELYQGLYIRFVGRTAAATDFIINDTWQLEVYSRDNAPSRPTIRSIQAVV